MIDRKAIEEQFPCAFKPDPELPLLDPEGLLRLDLPAAEVVALLAERHEAVARRMADPLRCGWKGPGMRRVSALLENMRREVPDGVLYVLMLGGNRAGKSDVCADIVVQTLTQRPQRRAWCFQGTQKISREVQQPYMWRYFPPEWKPAGDAKGLRRTATTKVVYTQSTGFSDDGFVMPNGSQCDFKFYANDIGTLQGPEQDVIWFDELVPLSWIQDAAFRLVTRNGIMLISFTPIEGYSDTVAHFLEGCPLDKGLPCGPRVESMPGELLPLRDAGGMVAGYEQVPLVYRTPDPSKVVVWFPTEENFYGNYPAMKRTLQDASRETILIRAYGVPLKRFGAVFQFREDRNVVPPAGREALLAKKEDWTFYMVMDPAGTGAARNPFMQWWAVNARGQKVCVREWPQPDDYIPGVGAESGVWAISGGKADGTKGPGQEWFGLGLDGLVEEILRVEREMGITIAERYMDSRAGNSTTMTTGGAVTLIEQFEDLAKPLYFYPAAGRQTTETGEGWKLTLQAKLEVHPVIGAPEVMVCSCCRNTIFSLSNWTGLDKDSGACKDPVDTVKYIVLEEIEHRPMVKTGAGMGAPPRSYAPRKRR